MTEAEWLACEDPKRKLVFLRGKTSDRKLRLFACACCRRTWHLLVENRSREALEVAERYAEGWATEAERRLVRAAACDASRDILTRGGADSAADMAASVVCRVIEADEDLEDPPPEGYEFTTAWWAAYVVSQILSYEVDRTSGPLDSDRLPEPGWRGMGAEQVELLTDLFGNPFRPVAIDTALLAPTVTGLATAAYGERFLPSGELEHSRLAVLSDSLEEVGCDDEEILNHLRGPGSHVRGCWVLDLILGKA